MEPKNYAGYEHWGQYQKLFLKNAQNLSDLTSGGYSNSAFFRTVPTAEVQKIRKKFPGSVLAIVPTTIYEDWLNNKAMNWHNSTGEKNFNFSPYLV